MDQVTCRNLTFVGKKLFRYTFSCYIALYSVKSIELLMRQADCQDMGAAESPDDQPQKASSKGRDKTNR